VLTLDRSKTDSKHLLFELAVGEVQRVPHARLVAPRVLLHLSRRHHCAYGEKGVRNTLQCQNLSSQIEIANKKTVTTEMVGADLKRLRLTHDEADLGGVFVLEQLHSACAALFPLIPLLVEPVELRLPAQSPHIRSTRHGQIGSGRGRIEAAADASHVEERVLVLLSGGNGDLLQLHDGRDLGAGVLILAGRRGLLLLSWTVLRRLGHVVRRGGSRAGGLSLLAALLLPGCCCAWRPRRWGGGGYKVETWGWGRFFAAES
jgi:hypothetical protein